MIPADDANDAYQEGYADGLAGAGMQDRMSPLTRGGKADWPAIHAATDYITGFQAASIDRRAMLAQQAARDVLAIQANMQEDA